MKKLLAVVCILVSCAANAADLKPLRAKDLPPPPACDLSSCSGFFAGFNVAGVGSNLDILGSGLNQSVFAGGGMIGGNAGFQFWNGNLFAAGELVVDGRFNSNNAGQTDKYFVAALFKAGFALSNILGLGSASAPPSQAPFNIAIIPGTALLAPYVTVGGAVVPRAGWVTGAGNVFTLAKGWNLDVSYMHVAYNGASATVIPGAVVTQSGKEDIFQLAFKRMF